MADRNNIDISKLSKEEIKNLTVLLLKKIAESYDPKKGMGVELFNAIAKLKVTMTPEAVCLRHNSQNDKIEIYLVLRSLTDTAYPGQWHLPGSAMRPGEEIDDVFLRLEKNEIGIRIISKKFIFHSNNPTELRGHFFSLIFLCMLDSGDGYGKWFTVDDLPENTLMRHRSVIIPVALKEFMQ
ncbi:MAG: hypothetical protein A3C58_03280 [Candidatus Staskawiczbacteria bacterium RIFCSPHIGHO2_02_FULL_34_10]|uniref:Nudix hydrolase domain-containing protein n=2 Tax=Candidatus Staskawicziibacteriota TaxID=1817916 RepID=A0A1G2HJM5_9BACT|nr:MAG: hypothetical protein A2639_00605 [Candidatus Staskawiczbacteria bacterium RIFCSPHIGHO2_01_FULL_34_27]OGZ67415.1 MAG: hypothetical protein A3C58_03280 [Candidatus Staskawiczbacteria bacterium RIFCSPHIGHO2_02_FULL_34_10]